MGKNDEISRGNACQPSTTVFFSGFRGTIWWLKMNMLNRNEVWCSDPFRHHPVNFAWHLKWGYEPWFTGNDGHEKTVNLDREPLHKTQAFIGLSASSTIGHPLRAMKLLEIDEVNKKRKMEDKGMDLFLEIFIFCRFLFKICCWLRDPYQQISFVYHLPWILVWPEICGPTSHSCQCLKHACRKLRDLASLAIRSVGLTSG